MKKITKMLCMALICCFACIPAISAKAATQPVQPTGLGVYVQNKNAILIDFAFDSNLPYYSPENPYSFGYEVTVTDLKGKTITVLNTNNNNSSFVKEDNNTIAVVLEGKKFIKQGFCVKVRSFVCDQYNQPIYSEYSAEKVVIPRANVTKLKALTRSSGRITWNKIKGAKKYTVYLSNNDGGKYKKYKSTNKTSMVINNMKLEKAYRVYVLVDGVKYKKKKLKSTKTKIKESAYSTIRIYTK